MAPSINHVQNLLCVGLTRAKLIHMIMGHLATRSIVEMVTFMRTWKTKEGEPLAPTTQLTQFTALTVAAATLGRTLSAQDKFILKREKRRIEKLLAVYTPSRAYPLKLSLLRRMMEDAYPALKVHLHTAWTMGLRLGTLAKIHHVRLHSTCWQTPIAGWKGRDTKLQNVWKFAPLPSLTRQFFLTRAKQLLSSPSGTPIFNIAPATIIAFMKRYDRRLSGHSPRRGAAKHLSNHGTPIKEIRPFLTHQQETSTRLYVDPTPKQPEALEELRLSRLLMLKQ
jgi:hypothetical protein